MTCCLYMFKKEMNIEWIDTSFIYLCIGAHIETLYIYIYIYIHKCVYENSNGLIYIYTHEYTCKYIIKIVCVYASYIYIYDNSNILI